MNQRAASLLLERLRLLLQGRTPFTPADPGTRPSNRPGRGQKMRRPGRDYEDKMLGPSSYEDKAAQRVPRL